MPEVQRVEQVQTTIPDYARPYVENLLGAAAGNIYEYARDEEGNVQYDETGMPVISGFQPYQQYQGDRIAQFSPMQQQAMENAALLTSAPQLQDATAMAGLAGLGALNTQYTYDPYRARSFTDTTYRSGTGNLAEGQMGTTDMRQSTVAADYMSPYMQNVVDVQTQQAKRQADIDAQKLGAMAARSGAFGGGRDAIMRSQANAELQRNLANIQATGLQNAWTQAQAQFNAEQQQQQAAANLNAQQQQFGAGLGLQGLQTALQGAQQLGNLGQTQFQQNRDVINLQNTMGAQQQQQAQNILNTQYQDFLNFQNSPYRQMGFMSDLLRGLPLTQQSSTVYGQAPSTTNQLVGLGTAALGASRVLKKGGKVSSGGLSDLAFMKITEGAA